MTDYENGSIIEATVSGITEFGIFVRIADDYTGLIHISEISSKFVREPNKYVEESEIIKVQILEVNKIKKQMKLSIKNIDYKKSGSKRKKIIETKQGFKTLSYKLPFWIEENLKNNKNKINSIDK